MSIRSKDPDLAILVVERSSAQGWAKGKEKRELMKNLGVYVVAGGLGFIAAGSAQSSDSTIKIVDAQYGKGNMIEATAGIGKLCDGLVSCSFVVLPNVMNVPDPVPMVVKDLVVSWRCGQRGMPPKTYQDSQTAKFSCD